MRQQIKKSCHFLTIAFLSRIQSIRRELHTHWQTDEPNGICCPLILPSPKSMASIFVFFRHHQTRQQNLNCQKPIIAH